MAYLIGMSEAIKGRKFGISGDRTTIGRNPGNAIVLEDVTVSSRHCHILHKDGRYILQDLGSTNGTRVNSKSVSDVELKPKQVLQVGSLELMFDGVPQDDPVPTVIMSPNVVIDKDPGVAMPQSFSSVSPFGRQRREDKGFWLVIIIRVGVLALAGLVMFVHKLLA